MYSLIALLLTLLELGVAAGAFLLHFALIFSYVVVYGSPINLIMNLSNASSAWVDRNPIYLAFAVFHSIKYFCYFKARFLEGSNDKCTLAATLEAIYLVLSAYYTYS
jgi:hypothetical protein